MPPLDLDRLLTDTTFVRRIARALVRDPHAAEDLAQDALVVALERPPGAGTNLRGWLVTVVRSLAIDRARKSRARERVEHSAADHAPAPDEIVARLDLSRKVAGALSELEEPYRTALYLRYVEELDPPSIAARLDVPLATAKTRLRRGLEILRARLDRDCGGRAAWSALAVPLAAPPTPAALGAGALLMSTAVKIAAALCLCGAAAWVLWPKTSVHTPLSGPSIAAAPATDLAAPEKDGVVRKSVVDAEAPSSAAANASVPKPKQGPFARVLDERRFPVEGAHVVLHVQGLGDEEATTDAQGIARFGGLPRLEDEQRTGSLLAWDDRGRASARVTFVKQIDAGAMSASDVDTKRSLGDLLLEPGGSLSVSVADQGRPAPEARVWLEVGAIRTGVAEMAADAQGRVRFEHLPAKPVVVRATLEGREGRAENVLAPGRNTALAVSLEPARTIEVTVVDAESKAPVSGARVTVIESFQATDDLGGTGRTQSFVTSKPLESARDIPLTDSEGHTRIVGVPAQGTYEIEVERDGYMRAQVSRDQVRIKAESDAMVLPLQSLHARRARWPLERGEVAAPPSGTPLTLRKETVPVYAFSETSALPVRARIEDGAIVAEDVLDRIFGCYAVAPDGTLARLWIEDAAEVGHPTSFRRPRRIDVKVLDPEGRPAAGIALEVRNEGNSPLLPEVKTDANGEAVFEGLWGRRAIVHAEKRPIGTVDLEVGDGRVDARLPALRELTLRLHIDGQPALPPSFRVWVGNAVRVLSEDPAAGTLHVSFTEPKTAEKKLYVHAPGFITASVPLPEASTDSAAIIDMELGMSGALLAHVLHPRDGRVRLRAEAWDVEKGQWRTGSAHSENEARYSPNAPDGGFLFGDLVPGRYRVREVDSERSSEGVEVVAGTAPAEVDLDLSDIVRVRGSVEMPDGVPPFHAQVIVEGEGIAAHGEMWLKGSEPREGHPLDKDGRFQVFVAASKPVTLRVSHPYLVPDPQQGSVVVRGEAQDVRLKLVHGDEVRIPLTAFSDDFPRDSLRVYAYAGEPVGEPQSWFHALAVDGVARFSGLQHGRWTLWIDPAHGYAPIVVRGVSVGWGITQVDARPSFGSTLRVRVLHKEGTPIPRIHVSAHHKEEPAVMRQMNSRGEGLVALSGIGAGTHLVRLSQIQGNSEARTITFDGQNDVEIEFDTRDPK